MSANNFNIQGLDSQEVLDARKQYGQNVLEYKKQNGFIDALKSIAKEPMVILLLLASAIYFISGKTGDGIFLSSAIILVAAISLYQDSRSRNALEKLKDFTQPKCKVIRSGDVIEIRSEEVVVGDSLMVEEGTSVIADGIIVHSNDFSVNESILTGESLSVYKDQAKVDNLIYSGTTVAGGLAIATVTAIGNKTKLGAIGKSLENIKEEKTPLELQISSFVKKMVMLGAVVFIIVWGINYFRSRLVLDSLLKALTLAMSILPEEIPVAFTTFMALGAWRLMKMGIVVKQMKTVETLGSATVICTDKTGTITENKMSLAKLYLFSTQKITDVSATLSDAEKEIIGLAMWGSEPIPFDAMEVALHDAYSKSTGNDERPNFKMIHEYPLSGKPPMMTHLFENVTGKRIIAAKGAPEAMMAVSELSTTEKQQVEEAIKTLATDGYRVLGVGETVFTGNDFPATQQEFKFQFKGLVAFYDPPKKNIHQVFESFYKAGIAVKIITGDNAPTTTAIAKQIGFKGYDKSLTGDELMALPESELEQRVSDTNMFTRMFPEAKLKIINALKAKNEIVAMTGDGVNDGPALKAAHIGIAMGKKGTEIARQAASLILLEDDLSKMVDAVAMGRKIYTNLKKAIQYIISIHIPIVLTVFIPLALGWVYPNIFSPVHIILLELIMGPTCSIIFENEPMERNTMVQKPRPFTNTFFNWKELTTSIIQGLVITAGTLGAYQYAVFQSFDESHTRAFVFTTLIASNIFLMLVNRSFYYSVLKTLKYRNNLIPIIISVTIAITGLLLFVRPLSRFFQFEPLSISDLGICIVIGLVSVMWYEIVKWRKRVSNSLGIILVFVLSISSCQNPVKQSNAGNSRITNNETVNQDSSLLYLDSLQISNFLQQYPLNENYRESVESFYNKRNNACAWISHAGINEYARNFMNLLNQEKRRSKTDSVSDLNKLHALNTLVSEENYKFINNDTLVARLELLLTVAFFDFTKRNWGGISNEEAMKVSWYIDKGKMDYKNLLDTILNKDARTISTYEPVFRQYTLLKKQLAKYNSINNEGGWPALNSEIRKLKNGDTSSAIISIKRELYLLGDLTVNDSTNLFDEQLSGAVRKFQKRNGFKQDGVIAERTLHALAVPIHERIQQILINMERCKWVPAEQKGDYLAVNIPDFKLLVYNNDIFEWSCNVVVGKSKVANNTVIFNDNLEYIVFSPYWNIPKEIMIKETLPQIRRNINYLEKHNMEVVTAKGIVVDPYTIKWSKYRKNFPYIIRQKPGENNALGLVKFLFPNSYDIYMHDTPEKSLFGESTRMFSHGCIRLEEPFKLARYLLREDSIYTDEKIDSLMHSGKQRFVKLKTKVPVFITYFTAWVGRDGKLNFRDDIYHHDEKMRMLLFSN